jgi:hypothetical protein
MPPGTTLALTWAREEPMSEHIADTPSIARLYCPSCDPEADPTLEVLDVRWCESHSPRSAGSHDDVVTAAAFLSGSIEAGGDDNRRWCEFLHRRR